MASGEKKRPGVLARFLGGIVGFSARRPRLSLWAMVFVGCAAVGITVSDLRLHTSRSDLLTPQQAWEDYRRSFGGESDFVVVVSTDRPNAVVIQSVLDDLGGRLTREPEFFSNVLFRIDQTSIRRKALQQLSEQELAATVRRIDGFAPVLRDQQWDLLKLELLAARLDKEIRTANSSQKNAGTAVNYAERLAESLDRFLDLDGDQPRVNRHGFLSPWPDIVSAEIEHTAEDADLAYLMNTDRNVGMLHVMPVADSRGLDPNARSVARLREHLTELQMQYRSVAADIRLELTGIPVLEHDELRRSGSDMFNASLIAFVAVGGLLSFGLRGTRHPMLVLITLVNSLAITFGLATLVIGHLNILSICFAAIMIGLGVDFGIHFVTRYLFLRQELYELDESLILSGQSVGTGIFTSAVTTAIAFGSAALTGYPGLAELGMISGMGILVCAGLTFIFLPALIAISDEHVEIDELPVPISGNFWRSTVTGFPLTAIAVTVLAVGLVGWNALSFRDGSVGLNVAYDSNLLHLQDPNLASVRAERTLAASDSSLLYAVAIADSREECETLRSQLTALPTVRRVTDLSSRMPEQPNSEQRRLIDQARTQLQGLPSHSPRYRSSNPDRVGRSLDRLYRSLMQSADLRAHAAGQRLDHFLDQFASLPTKHQTAVVDSYQNEMASALLNEFHQVAQGASLEPVTTADLPAEWRDRYLQVADGQERWLLKIYPDADVWSEAALAGFVRDIRSVAPDVTGIPVHNYDSSVRMRECYQVIAIYSLAAIALFLLFDFLRPGQKLLTVVPPVLVVGFIGYTSMQRHGTFDLQFLVGLYLGMVAFVALVFDFRNLRDTLIALIPSIGGGVMMLGLMALLQVDFNPLNLVVLPLVLGIGVDDGVHLVHDYRRQLAAGSKEYAPSGDTINGVLLTSLTSIIGFGSLMISAHQGLRSVGVVLALGVTCCLVVALILLPALLSIVARYRPASMEPVIVRTKKTSESEPDTGGAETDSSDSAPAKPLTRKERRRQQAA